MTNEWLVTVGGYSAIMSQRAWATWNTYESTDYDAAGEVADYLGVLAVREHSILVLGGDPRPVLAFRKNEQLCIGRWFWAESDADALNERLAFNVGPSICSVEWATTGEDYVLVDTALTARYLRGCQKQPHAVGVLSGRYRIETHHVEPNEKTWLLAHSFHRL